MTPHVLAESVHVVNGIPPIDLDAAATNTDVFSLRDATGVLFILQLGVTGAASTVTVTACDDFTPSNETAIAFKYKAVTAAAGDVPGAWTDASASGFATGTNDGIFYLIAVSASEVAAVSGRTCCRLKCSDPGAPTLGSCVAILTDYRQAGDVQRTAIV